MAIYRAKVSFSGVISMGKGEEREIVSGTLAKDLLDAGYIEYVSGEEPALEVAAKEPTEEAAEESASEEVTEEPSEEATEESPEEEKAEKKKGRK